MHDSLSTADFNALNNTTGLFLEVSTCAPKTITTFDTILYSQAANPYQTGMSIRHLERITHWCSLHP